MYYCYLSDGTKLSLGSSTSTLTQRYRGSLVYNNGQFESASFGGGRIVGTNNGANSEVHYFLTDHLGSTRVVAKVTPTRREDLDRKDYYPFGKAWEQPDMPTSDNRYTFSGKEEQLAGTSSIHYADFGARFYDSDGVTFIQQDQLLETFYRIGQYNYCMGNPVRLIDADGRIPLDTVWDALNILYDVGAAVGNHIIGDHESAKSHWTDLGTDVAALLIPYVPAGASKLVKGADKAGDVIKATKAENKAGDAMKRGIKSEKRVLKEMGLEKNTQKFNTTDGVTGVETNIIPDAVDSKTIYEIKDTKRVSNTKQIQAERATAKDLGKEFKIVTGEKTHVSRTIPENEIIRRTDLGPQK